MATIEEVVLTGEDRIVLSGISWEMYELLRDNEENWHVHMAYDQGKLELMSPSPDHESISKLIGHMIETLAEELSIPFRSLRCTTWRRQDLAKGLEADECYYILNHHRVNKRRMVDLAAVGHTHAVRLLHRAQQCHVHADGSHYRE